MDGEETPAECEREDIGAVAGVSYEAVTCRVSDGSHRIETDQSFGLAVYGYYQVGSYGFAGGSDLEQINLL